jgi:hypothetical protein
MLNHVFTDKVVLQKWLKAGYIEKDPFQKVLAALP